MTPELKSPSVPMPFEGFTQEDHAQNELLDVLAKDVRVLGIFSDWPGTVTYYDNCMSRRRGRR